MFLEDPFIYRDLHASVSFILDGFLYSRFSPLIGTCTAGRIKRHFQQKYWLRWHDSTIHNRVWGSISTGSGHPLRGILTSSAIIMLSAGQDIMGHCFLSCRACFSSASREMRYGTTVHTQSGSALGSSGHLAWGKTFLSHWE